MKRLWNSDRSFLLPECLRDRPQWVNWKLVKKEGQHKLAKIPIDPQTGRMASVTNSQTWGTFATACDAYERNKDLAGIGIVFTPGDDLGGVDFDDCIHDGECDPEIQAIVDQLDTYTEISPSGAGLHCIVQGVASAPGRRSGKIEVYTRDRFFTVTGQMWASHDAPSELNGAEFFSELIKKEEKSQFDPNQNYDFLILPNAQPPFEKFIALNELEPKFKASWESNRPDLKDQTPSGYCLSLASFASMMDWSDQEIANLLIAWRNKHDHDLKINRIDWYHRTISCARNFKQQEKKQANALDELTTVSSISQSEAANSKQDILVTLSQLVGIPITRWCQEGIENANYYVELDSGNRYLIGDASSAMSQKKWQKVVMEITGMPFSALKPLKWNQFLKSLSLIREVSEHQDTGPIEQVNSYLADYLSRCAEGDRWKAACLTGSPFIRDGKYSISINDLSQTITTIYRDRQFSKSALMAILRMIGWQREKVTMREGSKVTSRSVWKIDYYDV